jgi:hypothetical protein
MNIPKVLRWLRSRPLARVRRTLAIRKRAANLPTFALSPEVHEFYRRQLLDQRAKGRER